MIKLKLAGSRELLRWENVWLVNGVGPNVVVDIDIHCFVVKLAVEPTSWMVHILNSAQHWQSKLLPATSEAREESVGVRFLYGIRHAQRNFFFLSRSFDVKCVRICLLGFRQKIATPGSPKLRNLHQNSRFSLKMHISWRKRHQNV